MTKAFSAPDFSSQLTSDRTWRISEIRDLRTAVDRADAITQRVLLRALVTICYAHWEGYVRFASRKYLEYVSLRKLTYAELDRQFLRNYFLPRLAGGASRRSLPERCEIVDDILSASSRRFSRVNNDLINTQSNLSYAVFSDICLVCGLSPDLYLERQAFIDIILLKRRNGIAHGEDTLVGLDEKPNVGEATVELLRGFGDALENQVALKGYMAA